MSITLVKDILRDFKLDASPGYHFCVGIWFVQDNGAKLVRVLIDGDRAVAALEEAVRQEGTVRAGMDRLERELRGKVRNV
jgi:hypothetical protein